RSCRLSFRNVAAILLGLKTSSSISPRGNTLLFCEKISVVPTALLGYLVAIAHGLKPMATMPAAPTELIETYISLFAYSQI
ncbi:MAG TPA: hypothetical protein VK957_06195, partial [Lunatimonas sp.]|nr:hypothetical protein [Lunatimonas sp.]